MLVCGDGSLRHYVYVDNLGVLGLDYNLVCRSIDALVSELEANGLSTHETSVSSGPCEVLGVAKRPAGTRSGTRRSSRTALVVKKV